MQQPIAKLLFLLIVAMTVACFAVAYVSGVLLWIFLFDEPGPERGFETIMIATVMSPVPLVLSLMCAFSVIKHQRWIWVVVMAALLLAVGAYVAISVMSKQNASQELLVHQIDARL